MAPSRRRAAGFSLLEVLVSIIVLSLGLLGAVGMLLTSVRSTGESGTFTSAVNLVRELSEAARINKSISSKKEEDINLYLLGDLKSTDIPEWEVVESCVGIGADCDAKALAAWDLRQWVERVRNTLPGARVAVCFDDVLLDEASEAYTWDCTDGGGRNLVVKLGWTPRMGSEEEMSAEAPPRVVMQLIPGHHDNGSEGG